MPQKSDDRKAENSNSTAVVPCGTSQTSSSLHQRSEDPISTCSLKRPIVQTPSTSKDMIQLKKRKVHFHKTPTEKLLEEQLSLLKEQVGVMKEIRDAINRRNEIEDKKLQLLQHRVDNVDMLD